MLMFLELFRAYRERVELLKKKKLELKAARSIRESKKPVVGGQGHSSKEEEEEEEEDSSNEDDSDDRNFVVDWRAQHL